MEVSQAKMSDKLVAKDEDEFELLQRVNQANPSEKDRKALRERFKEDPALWQNIADLAKYTENKILDDYCSSSFMSREAYREKLTALRDELGWNNASHIEKGLIEQVCLNWLRLNIMEMIHYSKMKESHSIETGIYWEKTLTTTQRRYLRACESLAKVRKLLAEAELKEQQARNKRSKSTAVANKLLKDLTT